MLDESAQVLVSESTQREVKAVFVQSFYFHSGLQLKPLGDEEGWNKKVSPTCKPASNVGLLSIK